MRNKIVKAMGIMLLVFAAAAHEPLLTEAGNPVVDAAGPKDNPYVDQATGESLRIDFINGSFEDPNILEKDYYDQGLANKPLAQLQLTPYGYFHMSIVDGWYTVPVNDIDKSNPYAYYIELARNTPGNPVKYTPWGEQRAELNADVAGRLYQICDTMPGQKVYYQFAHRGKQGTDVMNFYLYKTTVTDPDNQPIDSPDRSENSKDRIDRYTTGSNAWVTYSGVYTIPPGQTRTVFAFEAESAAGGDANGNYLDNINLFYPSFVELTKEVVTSGYDADYGNYALIGEAVTFQIVVTNNGEAASSRTVLTDILDDGLEFVPGSVKINGSPAGNLAVFDSASDKLTVNIGTGAASGSGPAFGGSIAQYEEVEVTFQALVTDDGIAPGHELLNQARVTYNDDGFENDNNFTDDDNVSEIVSFYVKDRSIASGTLWVDNDNSGIINNGERRIGNGTVVLADSAGNTINDVNGKPLSVITDNDGFFSFRAIPDGNYTIRYYASGYATSPVMSGSLGNKGKLSGEYAVISGLDFTADLSGTSTHQVSYDSQNIGILPKLTLEKTASFDGGAEEKGNASDPVMITEDGTLVYYIKVTNHATNSADKIEGIKIGDEVPAGLIIQQPDSNLTAGSVISGQNIYWDNQTIGVGTTTYAIPVKADSSDFDLARITFNNQAEAEFTKRINYPDEESNETWHQLLVRVSFQISKELDQDAAENEEFVFRIDYQETSGDPVTTFYSTVAISIGQQEGSVVLKELPAGYYTITELESNWNYRINAPGNEVQTLWLHGKKPSDTVLYCNDRQQSGWLAGKESVINHLKGL